LIEDAKKLWSMLDRKTKRTVMEYGFDKKVLEDPLIQEQIEETTSDDFDDFDDDLQLEICKIFDYLGEGVFKPLIKEKNK